MVSLVHFPIRAMLVMYGSGSGPPSRRPAIPRDASRTRLTHPSSTGIPAGAAPLRLISSTSWGKRSQDGVSAPMRTGLARSPASAKSMSIPLLMKSTSSMT